MDKKTRVVLVLIVSFAVVLTALQYQGWISGVAASGSSLMTAEVDGELPVTDPEDVLWNKATPIDVPLSAQGITTPTLRNATIDTLEVRSLRNDTHVAFRITWTDATKNNRTTTNLEFRDAVAIQIAEKSSEPLICMGASYARMHIMQWKADWQADIEEGFRDLQHSFPNFWNDYYPYAMGEPPYRVPEDFSGEASQYLVGYHVGNPFSDPLKVTAVEDAVAEGFSTIETQEVQNAVGRGVWQDGTWSVVIARAMDTGDSNDTVIKEENIVAFAVWDGDGHDVGSRKATSTWITFRTEEGPDYTLYLLIILLIIIVAVIVAAYILSRRGKREEEPEKTEEKTKKVKEEPKEEKGSDED